MSSIMNMDGIKKKILSYTSLGSNCIYVNEKGETVVIVTVDGIIAAGKTTFCRKLVDNFNNNGIEAVLVEEPMSLWEEHGYPSKFYADMKGQSYIFQTFACATRLKVLKETIKSNPTARVIVMDRSLYADSLFVETLFKGGFMTEAERKMYYVWWDQWRDTMKLHGLIEVPLFLKTTAHEAFSRKVKRGRECETGVTFDYLQTLYELHCDVLPDRIGQPLIEVDGNVNFLNDCVMSKIYVDIVSPEKGYFPEDFFGVCDSTRQVIVA
jgi:deoxyadenosine/deoxycytidine kinase